MNLDKDTQAIIETMQEGMECSEERAILILVEFGMLAMMSSTKSRLARNHSLRKMYKAIDNNPKLKEVAKAYAAVWS